MDCRTARLLLDFRRPRPDELAPDEAADLERHLTSCAECEALGRAERRLDDHLGRAVRAVPLPDGLRERLMTGLRERRGAVVRGRLAWAARGFAVAATLLLGVFLWWHFVGSKPPPLDLNGVYEADLRKYHSLSRDNVSIWLQEHRQVTVEQPPLFDYKYLADYDVIEWQGRRVPKLVFFRPDENAYARARVYVVNNEQFKIEDLPKDLHELDDSGEHVDIWLPQEGSRTAYVIFYSGESLQPLMDNTQVR